MRRNIFPTIVLVITIFLFTACLNQYEKDLIGEYSIEHPEFADSLNASNYDLPVLSLRKDKTFSLKFKTKIINGKWDADDHSDWSSANFYFEGRKAEGRIGKNTILVLNPFEFECSFLKNLEFVRVGKTNLE